MKRDYFSPHKFRNITQDFVDWLFREDYGRRRIKPNQPYGSWSSGWHRPVYPDGYEMPNGTIKIGNKKTAD